MTNPSTEVDLTQINPSKTVHNQPPQRPTVRRLTSKQVGVVGTVITDLILAQVALALGGINIFGVKPFAFLTTWGQQIQIKAADAYNKAMASEAVANSSDANTAIALGQVATTQDNLQQTQIGLQTTWNGLWEASYNTSLSTGVNKTAQDVKVAQQNVRALGASGASGAVVNGQNIQSTWDSIYNGAYDTATTNRSVNDVYTVNRIYAQRAGTSETNQGVLGGNIQSTWNSIYLASGGTGPGNRSLADAQSQLLGVKNTAYNADENVYNTWETYYYGQFGFLPPNLNISLTQFQEGVDKNATSLDEIEKRVTVLEDDGNDTSNSGAGVSINTTDYSPGGLPNPPWTTTLVSGSNGLGVDSNRNIAWTGTSPGRVTAIYNTLELSDYQRITVTQTSYGFGPMYIYGRSNLTGTSAVWAKTFWSISRWTWTYKVQLWYQGGMLKEETLANVGGTNLTVALQCGAKINGVDYPRKFYILVGGVVRLEYDDNGVTSLGAGNRYAGFGMEATTSGSTLATPPPIGTWSAYDAVAANYLGAGFRAIRATTDTLALPSTADIPAVTPANLFTSENIPAVSRLFGYTASSATLQVKVAGWYAVNVGIQISANMNVGAYLAAAIYKNGSAYSVGGRFGWNRATETAIMYCAAGDTIQPAYQSNTAFSAIGSADGTRTYFNVAFLNNTKPSNPGEKL